MRPGNLLNQNQNKEMNIILVGFSLAAVQKHREENEWNQSH